MGAWNWELISVVILLIIIFGGGFYAYREVQTARDLAYRAATGWINAVDQLEKSAQSLDRCTEAMQEATDAIMESLK